MAELAAELFESDLLLIDLQTPVSRVTKLVEVLRGRGRGQETCLIIGRGPTELDLLLRVPRWQERFGRIAAWIIDSFWLQHIPRYYRFFRPFYHIFVSNQEDVMAWENATGTPTSCLLMGTDALRLAGVGSGSRVWDLTRIGRQPPDWSDDSITGSACAKRGITFQGRPASQPTSLENQRALMQVYSRSKFVLAFSNSANPTNYTHPTREYLTARWTDALACGAIVAGIPPRSPAIDRLLWPVATLDLGTTSREEGLEIITEAVQTWHLDLAERNRKFAMERLDWRWRFEEIAQVLGESAARLNDELACLRDASRSRTC